MHTHDHAFREERHESSVPVSEIPTGITNPALGWGARGLQCSQTRTRQCFYLSHGILDGPSCTLTEAMLSEDTAEICALRAVRSAGGVVGANALAAPTAAATRASCARPPW